MHRESVDQGALGDDERSPAVVQKMKPSTKKQVANAALVEQVMAQHAVQGPSEEADVGKSRKQQQKQQQQKQQQLKQQQQQQEQSAPSTKREKAHGKSKAHQELTANANDEVDDDDAEVEDLATRNRNGKHGKHASSSKTAAVQKTTNMFELLALGDE